MERAPRRKAPDVWWPALPLLMLFFFELFLFVLVMFTLALGEFVSRGLALTLWLVCTAFALVGYLLARPSLRTIAAGGSALSGGAASDVSADVEHLDGPAYARQHDAALAAEAPTPLDARWARTLLYNWRRANALLLVGVVAVGGWYWLST